MTDYSFLVVEVVGGVLSHLYDLRLDQVTDSSPTDSMIHIKLYSEVTTISLVMSKHWEA